MVLDIFFGTAPATLKRQLGMGIQRTIFIFSFVAVFAAAVSPSNPIAAAIPILGPACGKLLGAATFFASPVMKQKLTASRPGLFTSSATLGDSQTSSNIDFFVRSSTQFWIKWNGKTFLVKQKTVEGASSYVYQIKYSPKGPGFWNRLGANLRYPITGLIPGKTFSESELPELTEALKKAAEPDAPAEGVIATNLHEGLIFNLSNVPGRRNFLYGPWTSAARTTLLGAAVYSAVATPLVFNFTVPYLHPRVVSPLSYVWTALPQLELIGRFEKEITEKENARDFAFIVRRAETGESLRLPDANYPWFYYHPGDDGSKTVLMYAGAPGGNRGPWINQSYSDAATAFRRAQEYEKFINSPVRVEEFLKSLKDVTPEFHNQYWATYEGEKGRPAVFLPNKILAAILFDEADHWNNDRGAQVPIDFIRTLMSTVKLDKDDWRGIERTLIKSDHYKLAIDNLANGQHEEFSWRRFFYSSQFPDPVYTQSEVAALLPAEGVPLEQWSPQLPEALIDLEKRASLDPELINKLVKFHEQMVQIEPEKIKTNYFADTFTEPLIRALVTHPTPKVAELLTKDLRAQQSRRMILSESTLAEIENFFATYYAEFEYPDELIDSFQLSSLTSPYNRYPDLFSRTLEVAKHNAQLRTAFLHDAVGLHDPKRDVSIIVEFWVAPDTTTEERIRIVKDLTFTNWAYKKADVNNLLLQLRALAPQESSYEISDKIDKAIQTLSAPQAPTP